MAAVTRAVQARVGEGARREPRIRRVCGASGVVRAWGPRRVKGKARKGRRRCGSTASVEITGWSSGLTSTTMNSGASRQLWCWRLHRRRSKHSDHPTSSRHQLCFIAGRHRNDQSRPPPLNFLYSKGKQSHELQGEEGHHDRTKACCALYNPLAFRRGV